jgi:GTP cyclohydrolase II
MESSVTVEQLTSTRIPTADGEFHLALFENSQDDKDHLALVYGEVEDQEDVLVRIHSECFTGDVLGSLRCDCGEQLNTSMRMLAHHGSGVLLYLRQEGRGIGLLNKLRAYDLQDEGYDTVEANHMLGHEADERDYTIGAQMLEALGVQSIRLITNNPEKIESLEQLGVPVSERVPLRPHLNRHNADYLQTKVDRMRHLLDLGPASRKNGGAEAASTNGRKPAPDDAEAEQRATSDENAAPDEEAPDETNSAPTETSRSDSPSASRNSGAENGQASTTGQASETKSPSPQPGADSTSGSAGNGSPNGTAASSSEGAGALRSGMRTNPHGTELAHLRARAEDRFRRTGRPFVTLSYAQSLDGSIAARPDSPLAISGEASLTLTHRLRDVHDAILVGINTVLADDPRLNVRLTEEEEGSHPQPVVLDTTLRFPVSARLLRCDGPAPLIVTSETADPEAADRLRAAGADVMALPCDETGVDLDALLDRLGERGLQSLMVEGGASVLTAFTTRRLVDHFIITVAPMLVGGVSALQNLTAREDEAGDSEASPAPTPAASPNAATEEDPCQPVAEPTPQSAAAADPSTSQPSFPRLTNIQYRWMDDDLVLEGDPVWSD